MDETRVEIGSLVEVELLSRTEPPERLNFTVVEDRQADFKAGFLGASTPLAQVLLGKTAGETLPYPAGDLAGVRILSVRRGRVQTEDVAARRKAVVDKAIKHSDYVNAMIFAGSVNSKWGDYDIGKLDPGQWETDAKDDPGTKKKDKDKPEASS
jgi:hypothetical protein